MADTKIAPADPKETAVALKGLAPSVDESKLTTMFGAYGKLLRVKKDPTGGAHVVFASTRAAQRAAAALNGAILEGQQISAQHVRTFAKTTRPCRSFQEGKCRKGDQCKYWHQTDAASTPATVTAPIVKAKTATASAASLAAPGVDISGIPKHSICRNFAKGNCLQGETCRFAHVLGAGVLPPPTPASIPAQCSFYAAGRCTKGDECAFLHTDRPPQPPASKPTMCSFFAAGRCARGEQCAYLHESKPGAVAPCVVAPVVVAPVAAQKAVKKPATVVTKPSAKTAVGKKQTTVVSAPAIGDRTCIECEKPSVAAWKCVGCDNAMYCDDCKTLVHRPKVMRAHTQTRLPTLVTRPVCGECETQPSAVKCDDCDVPYCESCDASVHQFKSLRNHSRAAIATSTSMAKKEKAVKVETKPKPKPAAAVSSYIESVPTYDLPSESESSDDEDDEVEQTRPQPVVHYAKTAEPSSEDEEDEEEVSPAAAALAGTYVESVPQYTLPSESESSDDDDDDDDDSVEEAKQSIVKAAVVALKQKTTPAKTVSPETLSSESSDDDDFEDERPVAPPATATKAAPPKPATTVPVVTTISSESESDSDSDDEDDKPKSKSVPAPKRKTAPSSSSSSDSNSSDEEATQRPPAPKVQRVAAAPAAPAARARPAVAPVQERKAGISTGSSHSLVKKIEAYDESGSTEVMHLDPNLNGFERLLAHDCAERLGLDHVSVGEGLERHITISRKGGAKRSAASSDTSASKKTKRA